MTDIKPRIVAGEPVCQAECPMYPNCRWEASFRGPPVDGMDENIPCIPALRQQRDNAMKAACNIEYRRQLAEEDREQEDRMTVKQIAELFYPDAARRLFPEETR